jgi:serine/threonine protein phosphatase PrpC
VVEPGRCAIANVGVERAWLVRDGRFERASADDTVGANHPDAAPWLNELPAAWFGRFRGARARWNIRELALRGDDVLVLASGARDLGLDELRLGAEVTRILAETPAPADAARRLGEYVAEVERWLPTPEVEAVRRARWKVHSRLALAIVGFGESSRSSGCRS